MKLRELIILEAAGGNADGTGKIGDAPPGGGQGLSGQGTLKSAGVFIGHETPEQKHDYTAKSVVGKGIEWTKPTGSTTSEKVDKETELEMPGEHHTVGHDSEGVTEEAEASSTVSGDIATVAYPLFVRGKNNKDKRKNARAAVGQKYVPGPKGIGTGVFEGSMPINHATGVDWFDFATWALKQGDKYKDLTTNYAVYQSAKKEYKAYVKAKQTGMAEGFDEAHVVGNDSVIYRLDKENPMSDTEVLVLGGAGRYSLKALRDKARREAAELAQDLSIEHGGAFRRSATNIKQLTNTINTIVAAYNELARLRRKGGRGSRGITDEDANFIRECIRVVEQATQNYRLMENLTIGNSQNKGMTNAQPEIHDKA